MSVNVNLVLFGKKFYFKRWNSFVSYRTQFNFAKKPKPLKPPRTRQDESRTTMTYLFALAVATAGAAYAAVPLYRVFCQQTGYGGTTQVGVPPAVETLYA